LNDNGNWRCFALTCRKTLLE